jgi:uncharacterized protein
MQGVFLLRRGSGANREARRGQWLSGTRFLKAAATQVFQSGFKENFFDGVLHILPELAKAAVFSFGAFGAEAFAGMGATGFCERAIHDAEDLADGDVFRTSRKHIAAMNAATAFQDAATLKLEEDLLEIFERNMVVGRNVLDGDHGGILPRKIESRLGGIFAFGRHAHAMGKIFITASACQSNLLPARGMPTNAGCRNVIYNCDLPGGSNALKKLNTVIAAMMLAVIGTCPVVAGNPAGQREEAIPAGQSTRTGIEGDWSGAMQAGDAQLHLVLHISRDAQGNLSGTIDSLDQGVYGIAVSSMFRQEATLSFDVSSVEASYQGTISADHKFITGIWKQSGMGLALIFHKEEGGARRPANAVWTAEGTWQGALEMNGLRLRLQLHVSHDEKGNLVAGIDSLDEGVSGVPATNVTEKAGKLQFEIPVLKGSYDGLLNATKDKLTGQWAQAGETHELNFIRSNRVLALRRPQNPQKPYPYAEDEVKFPNEKAQVTLAATLTEPRGSGPFPAAVLIAGSGPHDRNETIAGHKPFLVLADYLTRKGIAVLRYDKRGVGKSTGSEADATTEDFASDAEAAISYLKTRKEIDAKRIGLIGHSEGAEIAPMIAAKSSDVAWIVLLAAPAMTGEKILLRQSEMIARAGGMSEEFLDRSLAFDRKAYETVKEEKDRAARESKLEALVKDSGLAGALPPAALEAQIHAMSSPWFRYFLDYDPVPALRKVKCPVLALNGEKDLQVSAEDNLPVLRKALEDAGNKDVTIKEFPGLNHLFQHCDTGSPSEYGAIEVTISPEVLETIGNWISKHSDIQVIH